MGTQEGLCQDATCSRTPGQTAQSPWQRETEDRVGMSLAWQEAPHGTILCSHPSGTQHAVPSQPWLPWHCDILKL